MVGRTWGSLTTEEKKELMGGMHMATTEDQKTIYFYNIEKNRCILGTTCLKKDSDISSTTSQKTPKSSL